jgi:hypothetical protein
MTIKCDIFLTRGLEGNSALLRQLKVFDPTIEFDGARHYVQFLGLNVPRIKAVAIVTNMRNNGVAALSVPVRYRDEARLTPDEALLIVRHRYEGRHVEPNEPRKGDFPTPMTFVFRVETAPGAVAREGGGIVSIDALDGHEWSSTEMQEYMYDFNNVL